MSVLFVAVCGVTTAGARAFVGQSFGRAVRRVSVASDELLGRPRDTSSFRTPEALLGRCPARACEWARVRYVFFPGNEGPRFESGRRLRITAPFSASRRRERALRLFRLSLSSANPACTPRSLC